MNRAKGAREECDWVVGGLGEGRNMGAGNAVGCYKPDVKVEVVTRRRGICFMPLGKILG